MFFQEVREFEITWAVLGWVFSLNELKTENEDGNTSIAPQQNFSMTINSTYFQVSDLIILNDSKSTGHFWEHKNKNKIINFIT